MTRRAVTGSIDDKQGASPEDATQTTGDSAFEVTVRLARDALFIVP